MSSTVPEGWSFTDFGQISSNRKTKFQPEIDSERFVYLGLEHLGVASRKIREFGKSVDVRSTKTKFYKGDTLFGKLRPYLRKVAYPDFDGICSTDILALSPRKNTDSEFLFYICSSDEFIANAVESSAGNIMPRASWGDLVGFPILLPPLPEQKKIASILTSVDKVIENTQKQIDKLQDLKKATMNELLTKGIGHKEFKDSELGRIPKSWKVQSLKYMCDLQVGYAFKSTCFTHSGIALLRGENVGYGDAKWDASRYLDNDRANEFSQYLLTEGDIVIGMDRTFTKSGSKITRISSKDLPCLLVQRVGRFRSEHLDSDFLWQLLRSEPYLNQLAANEKGMDIPHLSKQEILEPFVPLIPKGEQIQISSILKSIDEQSQSLLTRRTQIQSLKKSLMQDLLTGKVRVTVH